MHKWLIMKIHLFCAVVLFILCSNQMVFAGQELEKDYIDNPFLLELDQKSDSAADDIPLRSTGKGNTATVHVKYSAQMGKSLILDQEIEARQVPKGSRKNKQNRGSPYPNTRSAKPGAGRNATSVQQEWKRGVTRTLRSSSAPALQQSRQEVMEVQTDSTTLNYGYEDKGTLSIEGEPAGLKVARDGSFVAGIENDKVVIYVPGQGENEEGEISPLDIPAISFSLSEDSLWMATTNDQDVTFWQRGETVSQWNKSESICMGETVKAMEFSPKGGYLAATLESDNVEVINRNWEEDFVFKPNEPFVFDEQEDFMVSAVNFGELKMILLKWMWISEENGQPEVQSTKWFHKEVQNLYLSPDTKKIVGLNENSQCVWSFKEDGINISKDYTSLCCRRINMSEDHTSPDYGHASDVFFDDNSIVIIRISAVGVELLRTIRQGNNGYDLVPTYFDWPGNNDVEITNAFYIPDGDRIAIIFSDGSMRMRQNVAEKTDTQPLLYDSNFGEVLHYNGAKHCFLVRDSAGNIIVRQWSKQ